MQLLRHVQSLRPTSLFAVRPYFFFYFCDELLRLFWFISTFILLFLHPLTLATKQSSLIGGTHRTFLNSPLVSFSNSFTLEKQTASLRGRKFLDQLKPEMITLLDTDQTAWIGWTTNTGKYDGWRLQTHPLLQRKVYGVCQVLREHNDNWLFGPIVELQEAVLITIEITFTMRKCSEHPDPAALSNCHEWMQILVFQADDMVTEQFNYNSSRHLYTTLANLTLNDVTSFETVTSSQEQLPTANSVTADDSNQQSSSTTERVALYVNRLKPQGMFMALAVRDSGSCSTLRRVHVFHHICRQFTYELVFYPRLVPTEETMTSAVQGRCVPGAVQQFPVPLPKLSCQPDGRWILKDRRTLGDNLLTGFSGQNDGMWQANCVCDIGFGISGEASSGNQSCKSCGINEYKNQIGRLPCIICPANSHKPRPTYVTPVISYDAYHPQWQEINRTSDMCDCKLGYYRHPQRDTADMPCTKLPSKPLQLQAVTADPARIQLSWLGPRDSGGRLSLWFTVQCLEQPQADCSQQPTYINPAPTFLFKTLLIGLALGRTYTITVTSRNDLTELFPSTTLKESSTSVTFTLPDEVMVTVRKLHMSTITRTQFNDSYASLGLQNSHRDKTPRDNQSESQKLIRLSWEPPTIDDSVAPDSSTARYTIVDFEEGAPIVTFEYQVYVWMQPIDRLLVEHDSASVHRPVLVHFLSDTILHFTDLPNQATITVWVRPRTSLGWGTFTKSKFQYPPSLNDEDGISSSNHMRQTEYSSLTLGSLSKDGIQTERDSSKIIWLSLVLALSLFLLIAFLAFLKLRRRFVVRRSSSSNQMEPKKSGEPQSLMQTTTVLDESLILQDLRFDDEPNSPVAEELESEEIRTNTENTNKVISTNPHESSLTKEIDPKQLKIDKTIGEGEFGQVCSGVLNGNCLVAVKMLRLDVPDKAKQDFLNEVQTMEQLQHPNIVVLLGVVTLSEPQMIILEFMEKGSMDRYLQGPGRNTDLAGLMRMLLDICEGMKYISAQGFVHRDLAARNILVDASNRCKISDFGLARKIGMNSEDDDAYTLKGGKVPIRWTAPEAVIYRRFTIATDVWSFGIVSWELFSYGQRPYWEWTNQAVISMLEKGYRLPCPIACPSTIHQMMLHCWATEADKRPDFCAIHTVLTKLQHDIESDSQTNEDLQLKAVSETDGSKCQLVNDTISRTSVPIINHSSMVFTTTTAINSTSATGQFSLPNTENTLANNVTYHNIHQKEQGKPEQKMNCTRRRPEERKRTSVTLHLNSPPQLANINHVGTRPTTPLCRYAREDTASPYYNVKKYSNSSFLTQDEQSNLSDQTFVPVHNRSRLIPNPPKSNCVNSNPSEPISLRRIRY